MKTLNREAIKPGPVLSLDFSIFRSPLGPLCVAMEGSALVAISFSGKSASFRRSLEERLYAPISLQGYESSFSLLFTLLDQYFAGLAVDFSPIKVRPHGTAFDRAVWRALGEIPYGQTRSYAEVAEAIGGPRACRAVAGACARNMVPIVIPCHRVVRSDGTIGGWSGGGGVEIKKRLLGLEGLTF